MARLMYEFFRPSISVPVIFPVGILVQDRTGVLYRAIPDVQLPEDVDRAFYGLDERESFMNEDFLGRVELTDPETGQTKRLERNDPQLLELVSQRGSHHFVYSEIRERRGSAEKVVSAEAERLSDKEALRKLALEHAGATTRGLIEAYV
jgi:hypothetical protein